jgi:hypothetical protein
MTNEPSDAAMKAREKNKAMEAQFRGVGIVQKRLAKRFKNRCSFDNFEIIPHGTSIFGVFMFFETDKEVTENKENGLIQEIMDSVFEEFDNGGLGKREDLELIFEFDSDENVKANFGGSYDLRLR